MKKNKIWAYDRYSRNQVIKHGVKKVLIKTKTKFQEIEILDLFNFGVSIFMDKIPQSSSIDEWIYHECLVHPAMSFIKKKKELKILVLGTGEGATLREVLKYPGVDKVVSVDIDKEAVEIFKEKLPFMHKNSFYDKRVDLVYGNAVDFLGQIDKKFDIIISDITSQDHFGLGSDINREKSNFYELVGKRLKRGGVFVLHVEELGDINFDKYLNFKSVVDNFFNFSYSYRVLVPFFMRYWGFLILSNDLAINPFEMKIEKVTRLIEERKAKSLRYINPRTLLALFSFPEEIKKKLATRYVV